ncbi:MAG: hypothetical protein KKB50_03330 [Planctomycetes bacterium]|nr:hypothetical protein [Planctomycetota bacterium]
MQRAIPSGLILSLLLAVCAAGQVPPKYEIVTIDDDPTFNYTARMNNRGQIVYSLWTNEGNDDGLEIMLYDNGVITQLTDDDVYDRMPDINGDGTIVWSRAVNGPGGPTQIVMLQDGGFRQLTNSDLDDRSPRINNLGHVVWYRLKNGGCANASADIYFYDGQAIHQITNDDWSNQSVKINAHDQIVWTQYNFCDDPWTSKIMMYSDGDITQLSPDDAVTPRGVQINDLAQVVWLSQMGAQHGIQLWEDGAVTTLTDWGNPAGINNRGDVAIYRFYDAGPVGAYEVWLYRNGEFLQITDSPHDRGWDNIWSFPTDINELGEMVYSHGRPWYYETVIKAVKLRHSTAYPSTKTYAREMEHVDP